MCVCVCVCVGGSVGNSEMVEVQFQPSRPKGNVLISLFLRSCKSDGNEDLMICSSGSALANIVQMCVRETCKNKTESDWTCTP